MFQAYLITCLPSGKQYVGITGRRNLRDRWKEHVYNSRKRAKTNALYSAIAKYGPLAFSIESISSYQSWSEACEAEPGLISQFRSLAPQGYNLMRGGEGRQIGFRPSAESVERSAAKHRGRPCHENTRHAASLRHKGRAKSPDHRAKIAAAKTGIPRSQETRRRISVAKTGVSYNAGPRNPSAKLTEDQVREVKQRLAVGESQRSIARCLGIHYNAIWKIAHNLTWRFAV